MKSLLTLMIFTILCMSLPANTATADTDHKAYEEDCPEHSRACRQSDVVTKREKRKRQAYKRNRTQKDKKTTVIVNGKELDPNEYLKGKRKNKIVLKDIDVTNRPEDWKQGKYSEGAIVIEASKHIKKIIVDGVNIHTRSGENKSQKNQAPLVIRSQQAKKIKLHDVKIETNSLDLYNIDNTYNECVGLLCIDAPKAKLKLKEVNIKSTGDNHFTIQ